MEVDMGILIPTVLALLLGLLIARHSYLFYRKMKKAGAIFWKEIAVNGIMIGAFLTFSETWYLLSKFVMDQPKLLYGLDMAGGLAMFMAAYYGYRYYNTTAEKLEEVLL